MKKFVPLFTLLSLFVCSAEAGNRADVNADHVVNAADNVCLANILAGNLNASEFSLDNVVVVAPHGGDFTDAADAADWVATQSPSTTNRFVILVAPGEYTLTRPILLPAYTTLRGHGWRNTLLQRAGGEETAPYGAVVYLDDTYMNSIENIHIRKSTGGTTTSVAIYNYDSIYCEVRDCVVEVASSVTNGIAVYAEGAYIMSFSNSEITVDAQYAPADLPTWAIGFYLLSLETAAYGGISVTNSEVKAINPSGTALKQAYCVYLIANSAGKMYSSAFSQYTCSSASGSPYYLYRSSSGFGNFRFCYLTGTTNSTSNLTLVACAP
jgi:hypothetical protein